MLVRTPAEGYIATCKALRDADLRSDACRISAPTLCLVGDEDGATPPDLVRGTAALIPNARFEVIAGAGHLPSIEKPVQLGNLIVEHLKETGHV
jgi:pimeloyl-ACP methyl ester carboxylesterase